MTRPGPRLRIRLWLKLAIFGAIGVAVTHGVHLVLGNRIAATALLHELETMGRGTARLVSVEAADAVLINDRFRLHELAMAAVEHDEIAYCLVFHDGEMMADSFPAGVPEGLRDLPRREPREALVVRLGDRRYLDVAEPILEGRAGVVRLGIDLQVLQTTRHRLSWLLGTTATVVILLGFVAAFLVGRRIAGPVSKLVAAADDFDPSRPIASLPARGSDEIAGLTDRFNRMMQRLHDAHEEQERARQRHVQTERLAALGSLVAGVAHEINNPLAGLKNCRRRLARDDVTESKRTEYLELMEEGLERIEAVVRRLLDFGRSRAPSLAPTAIGKLAHEGVAIVGAMLARRHIAVREEFDGLEDVVVQADRKLIGQALLNLILNAAWVTPGGGEIRLRIRTRPGAHGIAVEDDGPGIPPAIRDRVLDPFFTTKPEGEGTGLGLSVTRTIVDAHGGELSFEFPARGTVATIWLPDERREEAPSQP